MSAHKGLGRLEGLAVGRSFSFGVGTSGYQVEGGYNGVGEPKNNFYDREEIRAVEPSGIAIDSWNRFEEDLSGASQLGCDTFRLSIEWARVQPSSWLEEGSEPPFDEAAIGRYVEVLAAARRRGVEPLVTLHHFTHPRWLGLDFWLRPESPAIFSRYIREVVSRVNTELISGGDEPLQRYVTIDEINLLSIGSWLTGDFPGGARVGVRSLLAGLDHLLAAHILAYDTLHDVYEQKGWPRPQVTTSNHSFASYNLDRALTDLLLARRQGIGREDLGAYLAYCRISWQTKLKGQSPSGPYYRPLHRLLRTISAGFSLSERLPAAVEALYSSHRDDKLDAIAFNFFAPYLRGRFGVPARRTSGGRRRGFMLPPWEHSPTPEAFADYCRAHAGSGPGRGLPLWVLGNGMCNRVAGGRSQPRPDGVSRVAYLKGNLAALAHLISEGVPVETYLHWSLYDNYEWGSYEPRFGLYGVDRRASPGVVRLEADSMGDDAAGTYRRIIAALRTGEGLKEALG